MDQLHCCLSKVHHFCLVLSNCWKLGWYVSPPLLLLPSAQCFAVFYYCGLCTMWSVPFRFNEWQLMTMKWFSPLKHVMCSCGWELENETCYSERLHFFHWKENTCIRTRWFQPWNFDTPKSTWGEIRFMEEVMWLAGLGWWKVAEDGECWKVRSSWSRF